MTRTEFEKRFACYKEEWAATNELERLSVEFDELRDKYNSLVQYLAKRKGGKYVKILIVS